MQELAIPPQIANNRSLPASIQADLVTGIRTTFAEKYRYEKTAFPQHHYRFQLNVGKQRRPTANEMSKFVQGRATANPAGRWVL